MSSKTTDHANFADAEEMGHSIPLHPPAAVLFADDQDGPEPEPKPIGPGLLRRAVGALLGKLVSQTPIEEPAEPKWTIPTRMTHIGEHELALRVGPANGGWSVNVEFLGRQAGYAFASEAGRASAEYRDRLEARLREIPEIADYLARKRKHTEAANRAKIEAEELAELESLRDDVAKRLPENYRDELRDLAGRLTTVKAMQDHWQEAADTAKASADNARHAAESAAKRAAVDVWRPLRAELLAARSEAIEALTAVASEQLDRLVAAAGGLSTFESEPGIGMGLDARMKADALNVFNQLD